MPRMRLSFLLLPLLVAACASGGRSDPSGSGDRSVLDHDQLNERSFNSLYHAVETLRPRWLNRPGGAAAGVTVILNNSRLGSADTLRSMDTHSVSFVQFYDATSAAARFGRDIGQGVIFVSTQRP